MSSDWRPRDTTSAEDAQALVLAVGAAAAVGAVTFWLTKTLLGRDRIRMEPPALPSETTDAREIRQLERGES